jgi:hypothetical protein
VSSSSHSFFRAFDWTEAFFLVVALLFVYAVTPRAMEFNSRQTTDTVITDKDYSKDPVKVMFKTADGTLLSIYWSFFLSSDIAIPSACNCFFDCLFFILRSPSGDIVFSLFSTAAPLTCKAFLKRVESNYYDGCSFYRAKGGRLYGGCAHDKEAENPVELGTLEYKYASADQIRVGLVVRLFYFSCFMTLPILLYFPSWFSLQAAEQDGPRLDGPRAGGVEAVDD